MASQNGKALLCFTQIRTKLSPCVSLCLLHANTHPCWVTFSAITFKLLLSTAPQAVRSAPLLRGQEQGALGGITAFCTGGSSAHNRLRESRHSTSGPYASIKAYLAPGEAGGSCSSPAPCSETHQRMEEGHPSCLLQQQGPVLSRSPSLLGYIPQFVVTTEQHWGNQHTSNQQHGCGPSVLGDNQVSPVPF